MTSTTITRLQQFKNWIAGKSPIEKIERKEQEPFTAASSIVNHNPYLYINQQSLQNTAYAQNQMGSLQAQAAQQNAYARQVAAAQQYGIPTNNWGSYMNSLVGNGGPTEPPDYFKEFRAKKIPELKTLGYGYYLNCKSSDYIQHCEWCKDHCQEHTIGFVDVFQVQVRYPLAFASKTDASYFLLSWEAEVIKSEDDQ